MFNLKHWLNLAANPQEYTWIEAALIKETPKAIKILFDGKEIWLPKAWILRIKRNQHSRIIGIKIFLWHWAKKV
ncbi:hypothetical protein KA005_80385 [bacterium]|nr:hypothetical protein [bacterium]